MRLFGNDGFAVGVGGHRRDRETAGLSFLSPRWPAIDVGEVVSALVRSPALNSRIASGGNLLLLRAMRPVQQREDDLSAIGARW
jgi:hypothetical protein